MFRIPTRAALSLFSLCIVGCQGQVASESVAPEPRPLANSRFLDLKNVDEAPARMQQAARATVRITHADGYAGTGAFMSSDGLLMTNNHVLGISDDTACALEGCFISLTFDFQRGLRSSQKLVFAEPLAVDASADVAFYQIWTGPDKTRRLTTPFNLSFSRTSVKNLVGSTVHMFGHPQGNLKKYSSGVVSSSTDKFASVPVLIIGGQSGSAVLNEALAVVGIMHHGRTSHVELTRYGMLQESTFTASEDLLQALENRNVNGFTSIRDKKESAWIVEHQSFYLRARSAQAVGMSGQMVDVPTLLAEACEATLSKATFASHEDAQKETMPCRSIIGWWSCNTMESSAKHLHCPTGLEAEKWRRRFEKLFEITEQYLVTGGLSDLALLSNLEPTDSQNYLSVQSEYVIQHFAKDKFLPTFVNINSLMTLLSSRVNIGDKDIKLYVVGFKNRPEYAKDYFLIAYMHLKLLADNQITLTEFKSFLLSALADPNISIGQYLQIEDMGYSASVLL